MRSRDVACQNDAQSSAACVDVRNTTLFPAEADIPTEAAFVLANATSFEGHMGLRWELVGINQAADNRPQDTSAALYVKAQAGLLAITPDEEAHQTYGAGSDSVDDHIFAAVGVVATNGWMSGSYVEIGYGQTDLFTPNTDRWKIGGLLSFSVANDWLSPFAQIVVDTDFGDGADSIQSFFGIDFDITRLGAF